jgi:hypothetical protein
MSRSVSYASGSVYIEYSAIESSEDGEQDRDDFDWYVEDFQSQLIEAFPSVSKCDIWLGREDHCIASNQFANFGISEYCGLVSIWCVPVEVDYYQSAGLEALRDNWIAQIGNKFSKIARNSFGTAIVKVGTASNGESFFKNAK